MSTPLMEAIESGTAMDVAREVRALIYRTPEPHRAEILLALGLVVGRLQRDEEQREAMLQSLLTTAMGGPPQ